MIQMPIYAWHATIRLNRLARMIGSRGGWRFHRVEAAHGEPILSLSTGFAYRLAMETFANTQTRSRLLSSHREVRGAARFAVVVVGFIFVHQPSFADDSHDQYFQGLRERRLFSVAEGYCLRRLNEPGLSKSTQAELTIELSRTLAEHATYRAGRERTELWQQARDVVDNLLAADPNNPRADQLELQGAIVSAMRGASLRWQVELAPYDDRTGDQALLQLQTAVTRLRSVASRLHEQAAVPRERTPAEQADGALTRAELRELAREAEYRIAVAYLDLGRVLPSGVERTAALHEANSQFVKLSGRGGRDEISHISRIYRAEIARRTRRPWRGPGIA